MDTMGEIEQRILRRVEENGDSIVRLCRELVRIPSVVGNEGPAQSAVSERLRAMGLEVAVFEPDKAVLAAHPAYVQVPYSYEGRPNVVGTLSGAPGARSLILNGHVDVVSPEPVERWEHDPWGGEIVGDRLYGRGSCDMKAGLAAAIGAVESVLDEGLRPEGSLIVQSVIEEEAGGGGTLSCLLQGHTADGFANPEPQEKIVIAMAGILYFRVRVLGKTSHAGSAHLGVNAIGKLNKIYNALIALDEERARSLHFPLFEAGWSGRSCHLNVGTYRAGDWPSTVAGFAEMECRISFIPGETEEEIKKLVLNTVAAVAETDPWLREVPPVVEWFGWHTGPWLQSPDDPFIRCFKGAAETVLRREVTLAGAAAGLDTRFAGLYGIPAFAYGPTGGNIHGIDEYVELPSVVKVAKALALLIARWCGITA